ncbi:uncharacterized protein LOC129583464 [Paramacrobiotus metropolitanus]|uniref:uncharacterized protein LOC129583464 n=1 Tax=Paramacrobiotus metropolitanus TaxID=2943436 RepID=UPI00244596DE|nr:uncharacterized protein LOC129583464 [Paramacrobiotus metropolitanus]
MDASMACCYVILLFLAFSASSLAQQCSHSILPSTIPPIGSDNPNQADGQWYVYRQMGDFFGYFPQMKITSVAPTVDPFDNLPSWLQWWEITGYVSPTAAGCGDSAEYWFFTGTYSNGGKQIGDLGSNQNDYIMRPTDYVVLYHDYSSLLVIYGCQRVQSDGLCATPSINVLTRKRPDQLSTNDTSSIDATVTSIFSKYCVSAQDLSQPWASQGAVVKSPCDFIDPPFCIGQDIQGMKNTIVNTTSQPAASGSANYSYSASTTAAPAGCKWPNSMPSAGPIDPTLNAGLYWVYRRIFSPEAIPVNQQVTYHDVGPSTSPLVNDSAHTYWIEYVNYDSLNSTDCVYGFFVGTIGQSGLLTGLIIPNTAAGAPQPFTLMTLHSDQTSVLYYGCGAPNLQTGICDAPVVVHSIRPNPLQMSQADKDALDALENSFFNKYGCNAANDVALILHTASKPLCTFVAPTECMQKHITGYEQVANASATTGTTSPSNKY